MTFPFPVKTFPASTWNEEDAFSTSTAEDSRLKAVPSVLNEEGPLNWRRDSSAPRVFPPTWTSKAGVWLKSLTVNWSKKWRAVPSAILIARDPVSFNLWISRLTAFSKFTWNWLSGIVQIPRTREPSRFASNILRSSSRFIVIDSGLEIDACMELKVRRADSVPVLIKPYCSFGRAVDASSISLSAIFHSMFVRAGLPSENARRNSSISSSVLSSVHQVRSSNSQKLNFSGLVLAASAAAKWQIEKRTAPATDRCSMSEIFFRGM